MARALALLCVVATVRAQSGQPEGEAFGAQTWLTRCQPPAGATAGGCEPDATDAEWITPATDLTLKGSGFGVFTRRPATCTETAMVSDATDAAACLAVTALDDATACDAVMTASTSDPATQGACTYIGKHANPFRSNDGLRTADGDYSAQLRGRQHQQTPNYYGRGGTQGAADGTGDLNKFNGYGSFTTLDTSFQRATASITALAAEDIDDPTKVAAAMGLNTCTDPDGGTTCNAHNADSATCTAQTDVAGTACVFAAVGGLTAAERETLGSAANTGGSDVEHGVLRCDVPKDCSDGTSTTQAACTTATETWTATHAWTVATGFCSDGTSATQAACTTATETWTAGGMPVDSVVFAPPLQGGSARLHRQVADFAEGTVCP